MTIDRVSNMLSKLKNAAMAGRYAVEVPYTRETDEIAKVLKASGFLAEVKTFKESGSAHKGLNLTIAEELGKPKITDVTRISKPGRRVYQSYRDIKNVVGGYFVTVVSTSRGFMSSSEARKKKLGGEVVCEVK